MLSMLISAGVFALGLLFLSGLLPGMQVRGLWSAFKAAVVCGILSVVLGKLLLALLALLFWLPVIITGPVGVFLIQTLVNGILLGLTARLVDGISFDRRRTVAWAAFALTLAQTFLPGLA